MKYLIGDTVVVTNGKDKGLSGTITRFALKSNRVVVDGVNKRVRSIKSRPGQAGSRAEFFAPIDVSNIAILDPKTKKPSRVGFKIENGKKVRISKASGEVIPSPGATKSKSK